MYKVFNGRNWDSFNTYIQLINWISQFNRFYGSTFRNEFLEDIMVNPTDTRFVSTWSPDYHIRHTGYVFRRNIVLNEDGNKLYDRIFIRDIHNWKFDKNIDIAWRKEAYKLTGKRYYNRMFNIPDSAYPEFRQGPWPYTHRSHYSVYRSIKTTNEKRACADRGMIYFNRGSRGLNLPDSWDDICRDWRDDGWKSQGKNKHQWENKVKTKTKHSYGKGVYVVTGTIKGSFDTEEITDIIGE